MKQLSLFDYGINIKNTDNKATSEKIIKASEMKVIKIESFAYTCGLWHYEDGHWHVITATIALLEENMVYLKEFMAYPFLYTFKTEQDTYKYYIEQLEKLRNHGKGRKEIQMKLNIHNKLEDMYYCDNNRYGCFEYWNNNFGNNTWRTKLCRYGTSWNDIW